MGCINLWPTLVHITTEVLDTLHPGVTGLGWNGIYITKVWLKTLITFASPQPGD